MNFSLPSPLPRLDRALLRVASGLVPSPELPDWLRCWQAELWHRRNPRSGGSRSATDLYPGLMRDAIWLRTEQWRRSLSGTALLCILCLGTVLLGALLLLLGSLGSWQALMVYGATLPGSFLCEAALVTLVSFATSSRSVEYHAVLDGSTQLKQRTFLLLKLMLVLLTAFLLSEDLAQPLHARHLILAEIVQSQTFVLIALLGLRWSFQDQDARCKHCLRSLSAPSRVGRPSWNFLDSNGTELLCQEGHGLLSVPEIETSWRRSSRWIAA